MAPPGGANVRNAQLADPPLFTQIGGVHGTVSGGPMIGTAGGFTGNWWEIIWDAEPPDQNQQPGWSAASVLLLAPPAGDIPQRIFSSRHYTTDNIFWQSGNAPASTSPPNPKLGSALGNCTWYAHGRLRELGYGTGQLSALRGNASDWDDQARAAAIKIDSTPAVGAIAQSDQQNHVAVVESVNADGTITVTESSYVGDNPTSLWNFLWRHRTVSPSWFQNFIHVNRTAAPQFVWAKGVSGTSSAQPNSIAVDAQGNCWIAGDFLNGTLIFGNSTLTASARTPNNVAINTFVAKYDPNGSVLWAQRAGGDGHDRGNGVAVDPFGNACVVGSFMGVASFGGLTLSSAGPYAAFITKYGSQGEVLWANKVDGANGTCVANGVAADRSGNFYVTGSFRGACAFDSGTSLATPDTALFVAKYDSNGSLSWVTKIGGNQWFTGGYGIAVDPSGNCYVTGAFLGQPDGTDLSNTTSSAAALMLKYDSTGKLQWARKASTAPSDSQRLPWIEKETRALSGVSKTAMYSRTRRCQPRR